jgi:hypothetical protein
VQTATVDGSVPYIFSENRKRKLHFFGHEERMPGERTVKQVLKNRPIPEGKSPLENQERDVWAMLKMIRRKWMLEAGEEQVGRENVWKLILKETRILHGPYSQWRSGEKCKQIKLRIWEVKIQNEIM